MQHQLQHTKHLWAFTKGNLGTGNTCLLQAHGFRTIFGLHNAQTLPVGMSMYFYVQGGYSLLNTKYNAPQAPLSYAMEMKHVMEGRVAACKTVANQGGYTDYLMSKDDWFSYADLQNFLDNASNLQGNWDIVTVRNRTGTLCVNLSDMIGVLDQNGYADVHLFICRSSLAHPFRDQYPGGHAPGNYPIVPDAM